MKNILLILILIITINTMAQKETIYFNQHWEKVSKDKAKYYRLVPLEKVGDLYQIKDYFINGNLQMEGYWSDVKKETLEGDVKWYFKDKTLAETAQFKNGLRQGITKTYITNGSLKTTGTYKDHKPFNGTFPAYCSDCDVELYENGKQIATYKYYKNSNIIAQKSTEPDANKEYENFFYDRDGLETAHVTMEFYQSPVDGKMIYYNTDKNRKITIIENYANFKDGVLQGEAANYNSDGELLSKGIYKDGKPLDGTFTNYIDNAIKTYKNGILNGEELFYSDKWKFITKGINKNGERWSGQFYDVYYDEFKTIVNYKDGKMSGKQISYYTTNFEKIAETSHVENGKKEGEVISFNKEGKQLVKGFYKDGKQWNGSFYDFYYHQIKSLKEGVKHGVFINYTTDGKVLLKQEYENGKLTGKIISTGHFENKKCECIYKKGEPYNGEVCNDNYIQTYKEGIITKRIAYKNDDLKTIEIIMEYKEGKRYKETCFVKEKKYVLIYKDNRSYNGVQYNSYTNAFYTFKKGLLEGPFSMTLRYSGVTISGNYKNNKHHGIIKFEDAYTNKTTTCTYEYGKPINGTILTDHKGALNYKDGLQFGQEINFESVYLYKNGERTLIYNSAIKNYKKGKLEGEVTYFKNDTLVNTNSYKNGKPFDGIFYKEQKFIEKYKKSELQTVTCNAHPYTITESYQNNIITKVQVTKENGKPHIGFYQSEKKHHGTFFNFDDKRFPIGYIRVTYKDGVKNGLEKQYTLNDEFKETLINTKTYKNGKLTKEIWHHYYVNTSQNVQGSYKNEKPFNGYFYTIENNAFNVFHFKEGNKEGQQYSGYLNKLTFVKTDSIVYKNGKPFQGNKTTSKYNIKFLQQYEKGEVIKTEILNNYGDIVKAKVTYLENGIVTKNISGKIINEVTFLDKTKEKAKVILYKDFKKIGTLEYNNDKITKLDLALIEGGLDLKYDINKDNKVTIKAKNKKYHILIYPSFTKGEKFTFIDFLNTENLFMNKYYDAKADFYLDKIKKPISSCEIKKGKPFNGTVIRYYEKGNTYSYKKYKNGERFKKEGDLTKKQLISILK